MSDVVIQKPRGVIFKTSGCLQFRCNSCNYPLTWSKHRSLLKGGRQCECLINRRDCQGKMMAGQCPCCWQLYAKRMCRSQMVANSELEIPGGAVPKYEWNTCSECGCSDNSNKTCECLCHEDFE